VQQESAEVKTERLRISWATSFSTGGHDTRALETKKPAEAGSF